ncbi:MAG: EAL domain-containing protein [Clostridia bacterium]
MNDPRPAEGALLEQQAASYAGRTRYTQLEYEALLANLAVGIAFTRERKFFLCNPRFAEMFGWKPEELIGQSGEVVYSSSESYAALAQIAVPLLTAGQQLDLEWEMRRKDGSTFLARLVAKPIDAQNTQHGTVWIVEDITGRKAQANELQRLLREQEAILGGASIGIVFLRDRRIVRCNRRYEEMYGYEPGTMVGLETSGLYANPDDETKVQFAYAQLARGQTSRRILLSKRKDGSTFWMRADGRAVEPQDPMRGSVWIVDDITEQRRSEEELQRVLAEQHALLNNVVVGIHFTRDRKTVRCNRRYEEMFGYEPGAAVGAPTRDMYFTQEEWEKLGAHLPDIDLGRTHTREQWLRRQDGSGFWCRISGRAVEPGNPAKGYVWLLEDVTERKRADESVQRLVREQDALMQNALIGIIFVKERTVLRCNRRFEQIFGYEAGELLNRTTRFMYPSDENYHGRGDAIYEELWAGATPHIEREYVRKDGSRIWCSVSGRAVQPGDPSQGAVWLFEDITQEREAEERVQRALAEQELILDNATVGIAFVRERKIQRCNRFLEEMVGAGPGELVGKSTALLFASRSEWRRAGELAYSSTAPGGTHETEERFKRLDGSLFRCRSRGRRIDVGEGPDQEWIWSFEDVTAERDAEARARAALGALERAVTERTAELKSANERLEQEVVERKVAEQRAQHLADHDALTGLPNRRLLEDRLTQALALSYRNRRQTAVMFVDLDRFKTINDSLGHSVGDVLLKEVASRLVKQLRVVDTICRTGGDEFVVVLPEIKRAADAAGVAQKIIETLSQPIRVEERELTVTPSIGISVFPDDGRDAETLIRNADAAMYHAKEMGRANAQFFTEQMNLTASRRLSLENDLRRAITRGELRVHFQPIVDANTGKVAGHEALVRWQHPERGLIYPAEFIGVAEETGLILKIGEWMLMEACRWATFIGVERGLPVSVNLSARQFNDPRLVAMVAKALSETGLPAHLLELEITESTAMQQTDATMATLKKLKELGVSIALDDFGTGYSSFSYLKLFPVNTLKIDRSFIADVENDGDHRAIVAAIIALAQVLNLRVVAEGVETEGQKQFLRGFGCERVQGYLTGKPLDADSAAKEYL